MEEASCLVGEDASLHWLSPSSWEEDHGLVVSLRGGVAWAFHLNPHHGQDLQVQLEPVP